MQRLYICGRVTMRIYICTYNIYILDIPQLFYSPSSMVYTFGSKEGGKKWAVSSRWVIMDAESFVTVGQKLRGWHKWRHGRNVRPNGGPTGRLAGAFYFCCPNMNRDASEMRFSHRKIKSIPRNPLFHCSLQLYAYLSGGKRKLICCICAIGITGI